MTRIGPLLLLVAVAATPFQACSATRGKASVPRGASSRCGPGLTDREVLNSAKRALRVMWGHEPKLDRYRVSIRSQGCNYVFVAAQLGAEAREDIVIIIDRAGHVKTIPVCCDLGDCPEYCTQPKPS
jgi:hypothetical protein